MSIKKYKTITKTVMEKVVTDYIDVAPNIRVNRITTIRQEGNKETKNTQETVTCKKLLAKQDGQFYIVQPKLLEIMRYKGFLRDNHDHCFIEKLLPFTYVLSGEPYEVVRIKSYDHTMYDIHNQPLPVAVHFDYVAGNTTDKMFDLEKLLEHLEKHPDVTIKEERGEKIKTIPSYDFCDCDYSDDDDYKNNEPREYISFTWHPDVETYREYMKLASKKESTYSYFRYNIIHKILGNDKFLQAGQVLLMESNKN